MLNDSPGWDGLFLTYLSVPKRTTVFTLIKQPIEIKKKKKEWFTSKGALPSSSSLTNQQKKKKILSVVRIESVPQVWPPVQLTAAAAARRFHKSSVTFYRIPHSARGCLRFSCCLAGARTHAPARHPEGLQVAAAKILLTRTRRGS